MATQTWNIDPTHTSIGFSVRHMVVAKVRGQFSKFEGKLQLEGDDLAGGSAEVKIDAASIDTQVEARDNHLRSADFFDAEKYPALLFRARKAEKSGKDRYRVTGDLTIRDVTREVELDTELLGRFTDPFGNVKVAVSATTQIDRKEFGLTWNTALETGGVLVGERIDIQIELQAVKAAAQQAA